MAIQNNKVIAGLSSLFVLAAFSFAQAVETNFYQYEGVDLVNDSNLEKMEAMAKTRINKCYPNDDKGPKAVNDLESIEDLDNVDTVMYQTLGDKPAVRTCIGEVAKVVLAHRDQNDGIIDRVLPSIMSRISVEYHLSIYKNIVSEAIADLSASSTPLDEKVRAYEVLKNIMSELKPKASDKDYRRIYVDIQRAEISIPKELDSFRRKNGGGFSPSPSKLAEDVISRI